MRHLLPDTLVGRTLLFVAGIMLILIIGSLWLFHDERRQNFQELNRQHLFRQVVTLTHIIKDSDINDRQRILKRRPIDGLKAVLETQPLVTGLPNRRPERVLFKRLKRHLPFINQRNIGIRMQLEPVDKLEAPPMGHHHHRHMGRRPLPPRLGQIQLSIRLAEDQWLNIESQPFSGPPAWTYKTLLLFATLLLLLTVGGIIIARRMARPMQQLADAAEQMGQGDEPELLATNGPREVRQTIDAFNRMQIRLNRQLQDRRLMLSAISHDLRTPLTTLRLRAEYIEDRDIRNKTLATLQEMEQILSVTLSFAKDEATDEKRIPVDLASLLQSLCDDQTDIGAKANYSGPERVTINLRPTAIRRALGNLIDNAIKYGHEAQVTLVREGENIVIYIDDQGPGIPTENLDQVFTPFFRIEESRNRETGGTGLGLALARTLIQAQGGELTLTNRDEGGLRATIKLFAH